ncbi:ankyrin repeat-containing domain protein, partial [Aspergillus venezuelensis]
MRRKGTENMDTPILPFELLLEIARYCDVPTLNALIRSHKRAAAALTTALYDIAFSTTQETEQDFEDEQGQIPELDAVFSNRVFSCMPFWKSDLLIDDLLNRFTHNSLCGVTRKNPPDVLHGSLTPFTLLQILATAGNIPVTKALIESGTPVDTRDTSHWTALHTAVHHNHEKLFEYLLSAGADILALDDSGFSLASNAAFDGSESLVRRVVKGIRDAQGDAFHPPKRLATPLRLATLSENQDALKVFIESGADPLVTGRVDEYALYTAITRGFTHISKMLIDATIASSGTGGINHPLSPSNGSTALHLAIQYERQEIASYLISRGADIHVTDNVGRTPLHTAIGSLKMPAIIRLLIENGADPTVPDENGHSPFGVVDHFEVIRYGTLFLQATPRLWSQSESKNDINMRLWRAASKCTHI